MIENEYRDFMKVCGSVGMLWHWGINTINSMQKENKWEYVHLSNTKSNPLPSPKEHKFN